MTSSIPFNSNPLASNPNTAIPFDVTRPEAARVLTLAANTQQLIELPNQVNLIMVASTAPFKLVDAPSLETVDGWELHTFYGDAEIYYNFIVGPRILLLAQAASAELVINRQVIWSALANLGTYIRS